MVRLKVYRADTGLLHKHHFNSTMVRLKVTAEHFNPDMYFDFNSTMVRLKGARCVL